MAQQRPTLIVAFLLFAAAIALARLHTYDEPLERDITTYAVIGHEALHGRSLYSDLWDHKPPAIHATFAAAEMLGGYGAAAIYGLGVAAALIALLGVMAAAAAASAGAALWAGAFWVVVSGDMLLQANQPNAEGFINAALILGFALLVQAPAKPRGSARTVGIGVCFALATLYKPVALSTVLAVLAAHLILPPPQASDGRARLRQIVVVLSVIGAAWILLLGYFAASGRLQAFWDAVVLYNRAYQTRGWETEGSGHALVPAAMFFLLPLFALTGIGGALAMARGDRRAWLLLAAYLVGTLVSIVLPGHRHPHYHQLWLPAVCVGAAWGVEALSQRLPRWGWALGAAALAACLAHEIPTFALSADQWSEAKYGRIFVMARDLAPKIDAILLPNETFYEFGAETGLYYLTGRRPPSGLLYVYPLFDGPLVAQLSSRLADDLKRERPELFVLSGDYVTRSADGQTFTPNHPVLGEILADYTPRWMVPGRPTYFLFTRNRGALEARATASPQPPQFAGLEPF